MLLARILLRPFFSDYHDKCTQYFIELLRGQVFNLFIDFFALKNSVRKETSLFVLLNVFLFDCSSIISSHGNSRGTKREAEAMFSKHKLRAGSVFETARLGSHLSALL